MSKTKVVNLSSLHIRYDMRVFMKICSSLAKNGYDVSYVVADNNGYEVKNNVKIIDVGKTNSRYLRILISTAKVYKMALRLNADIYHVHDPELLPYAYLLSRKGKRVIFDFHEDVPRQLLNKAYIPEILRKPISNIYEFFQNIISKKFSFIITATPFIENKLKLVNKNTKAINNFPILSELMNKNSKDKQEHFKAISYIGAIGETRGFYSMVDSMKYTIPEIELNLAGEIGQKSKVLSYENYIINNPNRKQIKLLGLIDRSSVKKLLEKSFAGLVVLLPTPSYIVSLPVKMFEYMLAGLPVIASNFPLWKEIVEGNKCGICVNPESPKEIAEAINYLYTHPKEAKEMGENGRKAVFEKYNWDIEEKKLINIYKKLEE